jgi:glucoamylase
VDRLIRTYEQFATCGQLLPEQVWDEADRPERSLRMGKPAGSAVPLVWAHAEYLKLLRSTEDGKVFDRIEPVFRRYCELEGRKRRLCGVEMYSRRRPIQRMDAGRTLRILEGGGLKWYGPTTAGRQ